MSAPVIRLGEAYPIEIGSSLLNNGHSASEGELPTFHSLIYAPDAHVKKGADITTIDTSKNGSIAVSSGRGGSNSLALLTFAATDGSTSAYSGALQPSRNEYFLLFNGRSFELKQVNSSALSMTEEKKAAERKRTSQDSPSLADQIPTAKRPKMSESAVASLDSPNAASDAAHQPARAAVNFSLAGPKTPPSVLAAIPSPISTAPVAEPVPSASSLTKSSELRAKNRALFDASDSDDSDDSDD